MRVSPIAPPPVTSHTDRQASAAPARAPSPAWLLTGRTLAVSAPAAPELRLARMEGWLGELGFRPVVFRSGRRDQSRTAGDGGWRQALLGVLLTPRLALLALREQPRLVLTNTPIQAPAMALLKLVLGDRVVAVADVIGLQSIEVQQATPQRWRRLLYAPILRALEALLVRSADLVLTVNDRHADLLQDRSRYPRIRTLRDTADAELAKIPATERDALGVPSDAVAVAFLGSLVYSRLEPIFAAWRELATTESRRFTWSSSVTGPTCARTRGGRPTRAGCGASSPFSGRSRNHEAIAAVAACDIAYSECWSDAGFPAKLFEYMALGKPIVAEGKPQLGEVLEDGRDACFFQTPADLASVLRRLARDPELRERLGRGARETFLSAHAAAVRRREFSAFLGAPAPTRPRRPPRRRRHRRRRERRRGSSTVVIPVLNGAGSLRRQLEAIEAQDYDGAWEVVVVDNGSDDGTVRSRRPGPPSGPTRAW